MFWFVLLLLLAGGGFYFYHRMVAIEQEIRAEQALEKDRLRQDQQAAAGDLPASRETAAETAAEPLPAAARTQDDSTDVTNLIFTEVQRRPGVVQTDLYPLFPDMNKKQLQQIIRQMADAGRLKRIPCQSSYQLYPA